MYMHTDVLGTGPVRCPLRFTHHPAGAPKHKNTKHSPQASKAKTQKHKTHALRARLKHKNTEHQNARGQGCSFNYSRVSTGTVDATAVWLAGFTPNFSVVFEVEAARWKT